MSRFEIVPGMIVQYRSKDDRYDRILHFNSVGRVKKVLKRDNKVVVKCETEYNGKKLVKVIYPTIEEFFEIFDLFSFTVDPTQDFIDEQVELEHMLAFQ